MIESKFIDTFESNKPLKEYPRPNLIRDSYMNLNGRWDFKVSDKEEIPSNYNSLIMVPFAIESKLSGIHKNINKNQYLFYRKTINFKGFDLNDKTILHIDACDQICRVYFNNILMGVSKNGYLPIEIDITSKVNKGDNELVIEAIDNNSIDYPYGKQNDEPHGMWYNNVSGIWKSVWIESVSSDYIKDIKINSDIDNKKLYLDIDSTSNYFEIEVIDNNKVIKKIKAKENKVVIDFDEINLWTPENPYLYDLKIKTKKDEVKSYFAFRKFSFDENTFLLNNKPYFIHGLLDQGYYVDGILTPCSYKEMENDIATMKELGFNTLRKHIKIEPLMFYYLCDKLGMLVFQDFVNLGAYSYTLDTVMPTIYIDKLPYKFKKKVSDLQKKNFKYQIKPIVNMLHNFASVVYYTIFNEGWGQHDADMYYKYVKELDDTRVVDSTSGWFFEHDTDVTSKHVYFKKVKVKKEKNRPFIVSEFGGYNLKLIDHMYKEGKEYGYKGYESIEALNEGIYNLYHNDIVANIKNGLAGCIYTQVSDVEEELNGILTYDRKVIKLTKETALKIKEEIRKEFYHD